MQQSKASLSIKNSKKSRQTKSLITSPSLLSPNSKKLNKKPSMAKQPSIKELSEYFETVGELNTI